MKNRANSTIIAVGWILSIIIAFTAGYYLNPLFMHGQRHGVAKPNANVIILWEHAGGVDQLYVGNVITDIGEQYLRNITSQGASAVVDAVKYISIGNATASASLTDLASEYDRQAGTVVEWINGGDYAYNCTYKWVNVGPVTLNAAGLHWNASGTGNLFAVANFAETTFGSNDNLTIRWVVTFNGN